MTDDRKAQIVATSNIYSGFKRRIGVWSIQKLAKQICQLNSRYGAVISVVFAESPAFVAALEAMSLACHTFVGEAEATLPEGE